jgi:NhaP-type Na+/H+ or K+/H+ antiporter
MIKSSCPSKAMLKRYTPHALVLAFAIFMVVGTWIAFEESIHSKKLKHVQLIADTTSPNRHDFENRILNSPPPVETGESQPGRFNDGQMICLFVFFGLLIGGVFRELTKRTGLPYAPTLLVIAALFGGIWKSTSWIGETKEYVTSINPELLLAIFIVPIVFEAAFNSNGYIMRKSWWQIFLLSFPSAIGCAVLFAVVFRYVFWYKEEIEWDAAIVFGSLLAFTDPVSIGELLRDLKAPLRFKTLLEAESHFTDGSVFVIFSVALHSVVHADFAWGHAIGRFFQLALGGPAMGIAFGIPTHLWLKKVRMDVVTGMIITLFGAYLCFFVSEFVLHVSGILAVEFFGLIISIYTKPNMNEKFEHAVHITWGTIVYCVETLLYLLAGFYIGITFQNADVSIHSDDIWKMFMFYFYVYLIRLCVLGVLWPLIRIGSHSFSFKELLGLTWGGIRGVMSIIFAMLVAFDVGAGGERFRDLCIYFTTVTVIMSMLINRGTIIWVLKYLGVSRDTVGQMKWKRNCEKELVANTNRNFQHAKKKESYEHADWPLVANYIGLKDIVKSTLTILVEQIGAKKNFDASKLAYKQQNQSKKAMELAGKKSATKNRREQSLKANDMIADYKTEQ